MKKQRLILISNRLPFKISEKKGKLEFTQSSGGLVSSIQSYIQKTNSSTGPGQEKSPVWVGTSDITEKRLKESLSSERLLHDKFELAPVFLPAAINDKFYNGFCNDTIWPLFHYFPSYAKFTDEYYENYIKANIIFCEKVLEVYQPGDIIWIHDYHLMLLPEMLRKQLPNASIGFFLHIPFPSFELFRLIPGNWRKEILVGLLGADLIGFHTNNYVQHFLKSIREILGYENKLRVVRTPERSITADTFPISIDYNKFSKASTDNDTFIERNKIKKRFYDMRLIISVDRLDYAKGLTKRLESYELFLEKFPEYHKKVAYILQVVPSRDIITNYKNTKDEIEGLVSRINGKYGNLDWTPVVYQYKSLEFKKLIALYLAADIALITPMRDGMNLVAKEFIASRVDKRGVLILSETAGASSELGEAILVNPTDRQEIANSIALALAMPPEEQMLRNEIMQKRLQEYDVMKWAEDFLSQLHLRKLNQEKLKVKEVSKQIGAQIIAHYNTSHRRLILLDYDGTLTPLVRLSYLASPKEDLLELLRTLSEDENNEVVIISGRPMEVLQAWFGRLPVGLVAEHGAFYKKKGEEWQQTIQVNTNWKPAVIQSLTLFTERCPGSFVEEKTLSLAWHYRNAEKELGFLRSRELINALTELSTHLNFQILEGNKVVEARSRGIDKSVGAMIWMEQKDFILAIGDDRTDEDMFRIIPPGQYSIRVGMEQSIAKYNLRYQKDVLSLLDSLTKRNIQAEAYQ